MAFRVEISPRAFQDLDEIARYIRQRGSFDQAEEWFHGIIAAIRTLEDLPNRCRVFHVRHWARKSLKSDQLRVLRGDPAE